MRSGVCQEEIDDRILSWSEWPISLPVTDDVTCSDDFDRTNGARVNGRRQRTTWTSTNTSFRLAPQAYCMNNH
nr:hypothetical protein CFP56_56442 [Quercus suber]